MHLTDFLSVVVENFFNASGGRQNAMAEAVISGGLERAPCLGRAADDLHHIRQQH